MQVAPSIGYFGTGDVETSAKLKVTTFEFYMCNLETRLSFWSGFFSPLTVDSKIDMNLHNVMVVNNYNILS